LRERGRREIERERKFGLIDPVVTPGRRSL
jgi:hypothetical protein